MESLKKYSHLGFTPMIALIKSENPFQVENPNPFLYFQGGINEFVGGLELKFE